MIFDSKQTKEQACSVALQAVAMHMAKVATDPMMSIDDRIKTLQWVQKKIPEINRLLIYLNTQRINK